MRARKSFIVEGMVPLIAFWSSCKELMAYKLEIDEGKIPDKDMVVSERGVRKTKRKEKKRKGKRKLITFQKIFLQIYRLDMTRGCFSCTSYTSPDNRHGMRR